MIFIILQVLLMYVTNPIKVSLLLFHIADIFQTNKCFDLEIMLSCIKVNIITFKLCEINFVLIIVHNYKIKQTICLRKWGLSNYNIICTYHRRL